MNNAAGCARSVSVLISVASMYAPDMKQLSVKSLRNHLMYAMAAVRKSTVLCQGSSIPQSMHMMNTVVSLSIVEQVLIRRLKVYRQ